MHNHNSFDSNVALGKLRSEFSHRLGQTRKSEAAPGMSARRGEADLIGEKADIRREGPLLREERKSLSGRPRSALCQSLT